MRYARGSQNQDLHGRLRTIARAPAAGCWRRRGAWAGGCTGSLGWLVDFRAQIPWSEPPRMAVKMGGWVCKISNFQDV